MVFESNTTFFQTSFFSVILIKFWNFEALIWVGDGIDGDDDDDDGDDDDDDDDDDDEEEEEEVDDNYNDGAHVPAHDAQWALLMAPYLS